MIPKLIHQTAKTAKADPKWEPFQRVLLNLHPDWTYRLWTDEDNLKLLQQKRPDLVSVYLDLPKPVMRADMMRYVYMEEFGGLYLDLDYQMLKPFDLLDKHLVLPLESDPGVSLYFGNCVFASEPGHPFWKALLQELVTRRSAKSVVANEEDVIHQTGPGLVTEVWYGQFQKDPSIFAPPRLWFHPKTPQTDNDLDEVISHPETYGVHWCFGSWRALTPWARAKNKLKSLFKK